MGGGPPDAELFVAIIVGGVGSLRHAVRRPPHRVASGLTTAVVPLGERGGDLRHHGRSSCCCARAASWARRDHVVTPTASARSSANLPGAPCESWVRADCGAVLLAADRRYTALAQRVLCSPAPRCRLTSCSASPASCRSAPAYFGLGAYGAGLTLKLVPKHAAGAAARACCSAGSPRRPRRAHRQAVAGFISRW